MRKIFIITFCTFLPELLWSCNNSPEEKTHHPQHPCLSPCLPHLFTPTEFSEDSEDSSTFLRKINALNLFVPQLEYTSRSEHFYEKYILFCNIQKLKEKNDFIEDALESFKIFYQHQLCLFQRRINSLSLSLSHIKFENDDLLEENARLQNELSLLENDSSNDTETSFESTSNISSSFSDGEEYLDDEKITSESIKNPFEVLSIKSDVCPPSKSNKYNIPRLNLQNLNRSIEKVIK